MKKKSKEEAAKVMKNKLRSSLLRMYDEKLIVARQQMGIIEEHSELFTESDLSQNISVKNLDSDFELSEENEEGVKELPSRI